MRFEEQQFSMACAACSGNLVSAATAAVSSAFDPTDRHKLTSKTGYYWPPPGFEK
jgi:hypothetical protein